MEIAVASFIRFRPIPAMLGVALRVELYGVIAFGGMLIKFHCSFFHQQSIFNDKFEFHGQIP